MASNPTGVLSNEWIFRATTRCIATHPDRTTWPCDECKRNTPVEEAAVPSVPAGVPLQGTWPRGVHRAFVEGAQWWEFHKTGATMFPSDRDLAEERAVEKYGPADERPAKEFHK